MDYPSILGDNNLLINKSGEDWKHVKNLDKFFTCMYKSYTSKGLLAVILIEFSSLISLGFTIGFSVYLAAFVDWDEVSKCYDEESCSELNHSFTIDPFELNPTFFGFLTMVYFIIFSTFWLYKLSLAYSNILEAMDMEKFYLSKLGINHSDLQNMEWYQVVDRLIFLHKHGVYRVAVKENLTVHDIVLRIMRKENYLIGMINHNILDLHAPWWTLPMISNKLFLTNSLEWSLTFCILDYMFDEQFRVSKHFLEDFSGLQWRFRAVGIINLMLTPFMLIFMVVNFLLQNTQQFHSSKAYLGPRQWSPLAKWKFREFNELSHIFEERMNKSVTIANDFISSFHNPHTVIVAQCAAYIAGAIVGVLLIISFISEGVLLYVYISEHNLLWYLGIFSAVYAGSRSLIPDGTKIRLNRKELIEQMNSFTHFDPPEWKDKEHSYEVRDQLCELFQFKAQIFWMEILSVILTPTVLFFSLPNCAENILDFVREHSRYIDGVGAVCDFSLFEFEEYKDNPFDSLPPTRSTISIRNPVQANLDDSSKPSTSLPILTKSSQLLPPNMQLSRKKMNAHGTVDAKLEKSYLNFQKTYPTFEGIPAADNVFNQFHTYLEMNQYHRDQSILSTVGKSLSLSAYQNFDSSVYQIPNDSLRMNASFVLPVNQNYQRPNNYTQDHPVNLRHETITHMNNEGLDQSQVETHRNDNKVGEVHLDSSPNNSLDEDISMQRQDSMISSHYSPVLSNPSSPILNPFGTVYKTIETGDHDGQINDEKKPLIEKKILSCITGSNTEKRPYIQPLQITTERDLESDVIFSKGLNTMAGQLYNNPEKRTPFVHSQHGVLDRSLLGGSTNLGRSTGGNIPNQEKRNNVQQLEESLLSFSLLQQQGLTSSILSGSSQMYQSNYIDAPAMIRAASLPSNNKDDYIRAINSSTIKSPQNWTTSSKIRQTQQSQKQTQQRDIINTRNVSHGNHHFLPPHLTRLAEETDMEKQE